MLVGDARFTLLGEASHGTHEFYRERAEITTAAQRARYRYSCFDHFGENTQAYGYAAAFGLDQSCEDEVVDQLVELTRESGRREQPGGKAEADERFHAEQNARLVKNAEEYYRTMFRGRVSSWNLRDRPRRSTLRAPRRSRARLLPG